ncbi:hypothetical protein GCM10009411_12270 [Shewanella litoralis]|uniref:Uncharacterized protein n=1 Tax=Shewanella litoralis TaxID=2282700 RepID=A0ABQ2R4D6_9GAMM|nr:hypothetical protein GCM10009411_12270 [Shewanella litoralis]
MNLVLSRQLILLNTTNKKKRARGSLKKSRYNNKDGTVRLFCLSIVDISRLTNFSSDEMSTK